MSCTDKQLLGQATIAVRLDSWLTLRQKRTDGLPSRHLPHSHLKDIDLVLGGLDLSRARSAAESSRLDEISQVLDLALIIPDPSTVRQVVACPAPEKPTVFGAEAGVSAVTAASWAG